MIGAIAAALLSVTASPPFPNLSEIRPIDLHSGVNPVPAMGPSGEDGVIVEGFRLYFTADGSYDVYEVLIRDRASNEWDVVTHGDTPDDNPADPVIFGDAPHTGEDMVRSIRFARARLNGAPAFVALIAQRGMEGPIPAPSHVTFTLYRLVRRPEDGGFMFLRVGVAKAKACYGNTDLALHAELGLPLPSDYEGPRRAGACGAW